MTTRRALALLVAAATTLAVSACASGDGKTLQPPTAPPPTSSSLPTIEADNDPADYQDQLPGAGGLRISLPWIPDGEMDTRFGCAGAGLSPFVAWEDTPDGTAEIAVVISDEAGRAHWMLLGIDPSVIAIPEGVTTGDLLSQGVEVVPNDFGEQGWTAPCPGEGTSERYTIRVYALSQQIEGTGLMDAAEIADLLNFVSIEIAESTGIYSRPG
jgi:Raf kinase inhibitor-like YbhB/YbcL family protein